MKDLKAAMLRLVEACEEYYGTTPERIVVEPNGAIEVNGRVGLREERHPEVIFVTRRGA